MRIVLISALLTPVAAGCGAQKSGGQVNVVASTNVYGNIAAQIGGHRVKVTSVLTNPNADPHLFEPGTATGLAVAGAKVIIQNGLGYDAFMNRLESAAPSSGRVQVTIADVLGISGANANPHLWYDIPVLGRIAAAIEQALVRADARRAATYRMRLAHFDRSLRPLRSVVTSIRSRYRGAPVAYTEPVPGYLLAAAGLRNLAPRSFTRAIEDGTEPSPAALSQMLALFRGHRVRVLLYNRQTVSPITVRIRSAARQAGIPVIGVSETLPPGMTFQQWQTRQAKALQNAVRR